MRAKVALCRRMRVWIDVERIVWASLHARLATYASGVVEVDNSVIAAEQGTGRTYLDAWRSIAMIAAHYPKMPACIRELALLDVFNPGPENAHGHRMLVLAGDCAGVAADTAIMID
jgi:hypothetical protein